MASDSYYFNFQLGRFTPASIHDPEYPPEIYVPDLFNGRWSVMCCEPYLSYPSREYFDCFEDAQEYALYKADLMGVSLKAH